MKTPIYKRCQSCRYRHGCDLPFPPQEVDCKHWKLGKCYTCKYVDAPDDEWFPRGCETWCFGGCKKYKRDWRKTFDYILIKFKR